MYVGRRRRATAAAAGVEREREGERERERERGREHAPAPRRISTHATAENERTCGGRYFRVAFHATSPSND